MKTISRTPVIARVLLAVSTLFLPMCAVASTGDFYSSYEVQVIAHLTLSGRPARQMFLQQEGNKQYLYVRQSGQQGFTVVDVTKPGHAKVVNHVPESNVTMLDSGIAISETPDNPANVSTSHLAGTADSGRDSAHSPELVRVLNVSDPAHPRTIKTFDGVTSILRDDARQLIYLANADGIWILSHQQVLRRHLCSSSDAISSAIPNCD